MITILLALIHVTQMCILIIVRIYSLPYFITFISFISNKPIICFFKQKCYVAWKEMIDINLLAMGKFDNSKSSQTTGLILFFSDFSLILWYNPDKFCSRKKTVVIY